LGLGLSFDFRGGEKFGHGFRDETRWPEADDFSMRGTAKSEVATTD
jgi:hypothetical protein